MNPAGMVGRIKRIKEDVQRSVNFDPRIFEHEVAEKVNWSPLKSGGANWQTHHLQEVSARRMDFKGSYILLLMGIASMLLGVGVCWVIFSPGIVTANVPFWVSLIGLVAILMGGYMIWEYRTPIVFDKEKGIFYHGKAEKGSKNALSDKKTIALDQIVALQLIKERMISVDHTNHRRRSYESYELNLVLQDASRVQVVDHGNLTALQADAEKLAQFLEIPLWDKVAM